MRKAGCKGTGNGTGEPVDLVWPDRPDIDPITYDGTTGLISRIDFDDGSFKTYTWSAAGVLLSIGGENADGVIQSKTFTYDADGRVVSTSTTP